MKEKETAAEETVIKLEHICKSYYIGTQEVPVLTDIQLTINKGSFISIMGPSGAGKSTLVRCINLHNPLLTKGERIVTVSESSGCAAGLRVAVVTPLVLVMARSARAGAAKSSAATTSDSASSPMALL